MVLRSSGPVPRCAPRATTGGLVRPVPTTTTTTTTRPVVYTAGRKSLLGRHCAVALSPIDSRDCRPGPVVDRLEGVVIDRQRTALFLRFSAAVYLFTFDEHGDGYVCGRVRLHVFVCSRIFRFLTKYS